MSHQATFEAVKRQHEDKISHRREQLARAEHHAEQLGAAIRNGSTNATIQYHATRARQAAEQCGIAVYIREA